MMKHHAALVAGLVSCAVSGQAEAELPADYRTLLDAAAARQDDAAYFATASLIASMSETGRADVLAHVSAHAAARLHLFADWQNDAAAAPVATPPGEVGQEAAPHVALRDAPEAMTEAPDGSSGWLARSLNPQLPEHWTGRASFGLQIDQGNVDLLDFSFALELDREIEDGWNLDSRFAFAFSQAEQVTTRDNWLLEARLSRTFDQGVGYYLGGSFEDDEVGSYARSAFATGGAIWQVVDNPRFDWSLRAGGGLRYREERLTGDGGWDDIIEAGSHLHWQITETARLESETTAYAGGGSRLTQNLTVRTPLAEHWAMETALRARHEFDAEPGVEPTETSMNVSLSRDF